MTADFKDCTFQGNSTHCYETEDQEGQPVTDGGFGGAIYVQDVELTLDNCTIENNTAEDSGGGVYFTGNDPSLLTLNIKGATKIGDNSAPKAENLYLLNIALPGSTEEGSAADEFQTVLTVSDGLTTAAIKQKSASTWINREFLQSDIPNSAERWNHPSISRATIQITMWNGLRKGTRRL